MEEKINRNTCLFIVFLLLAGVANVLSRSSIALLESVMTVVNYLILTGLLLYWIQSVRVRLLPSRARTWTVSAGLMMLFYQLLRIFRYRFAVDVPVHRYAVYLYFVPMTAAPALFLMTCLCICRRNTQQHGREALLLIPTGLLCLLSVTNDLHGLVYAPKIDLSVFMVDAGTYRHGPVFFLIYGWMGLSLLAGLVLLFRQTGRVSGAALREFLGVLIIWITLITIFDLWIDGTNRPRMYNMPEIHTFSLLAVFEVCIRNRLIPGNVDYPGFFHALCLPVLITDRAFHPVYHSGAGLNADEGLLRAALSASVQLTPDLKLSGGKIRGGYAFWTEDETAVHQAQERLAEANEFIESENSLIQAETEQRERNAWLQSRHRIYHEIAEILYPVQRRIEELLGRMEPGTASFREDLARVSVLNAYVKRKTNLLLLASEEDTLPVRDLMLALKESGNYLTLAGLRTDTQQTEEGTLSADRLIAIYDAFESIAEQLIGSASSLMISVGQGGITLATDAAQAPDVTGFPLPVRVRVEEGILFMDLPSRKGGETA